MKRSFQTLFGGTGKTAVVTGATGVLCGQMAQILGEAGYNVVVAGRDQQRGQQRVASIEEQGGTACFVEVDVSSRESIESLLAQVVEQYGQVDVLVNGAGANSPTPFFEITEEEWDRLMGVNLKSMFLSCQVFGQHMTDRKSGSVINIGSVSAGPPLSRVFTYSVTKAGVVNLTKNLAREWGENGVRANVIIPGFFPAEQNRRVLTPDRIDSIRSHTPMLRHQGDDERSPFGMPEELDGITLLLASSVAGSFMTGGEYVVDGGFLCQTI